MREPEPVHTFNSSREFCDYVAHELTNPLSGMFTSVEILEQYLKAQPRAMEEAVAVLVILKKEINRLMMLLRELRSSGVLSPTHLQPTSLLTEIRELLTLEAVHYERRRIRVNQYVALDLPPIMADRDKLRQVLLNLCKNAVEAMPNGGTLTFRSYQSGGWVCLDIADTGEGIPERMPVFEPAVTNKPHSDGLGLAIVREIVGQHEGTVSYTTQYAKGTTFHLKFPTTNGAAR